MEQERTWFPKEKENKKVSPKLARPEKQKTGAFIKPRFY